VQRAATDKLERLTPAGGDFATTIADAAKTASLQGGAADVSAPTSALPGDVAGHATLVRKDTGDKAVYRKFEAFVLQMFVESMLPKDANNIFGKGTAGTIWRSMMAEQLGNEIAKGDGIGIAKQLAKSRSLAGGGKTES
jgi:hypothetical protein